MPAGLSAADLLSWAARAGRLTKARPALCSHSKFRVVPVTGTRKVWPTVTAPGSRPGGQRMLRSSVIRSTTRDSDAEGPCSKPALGKQRLRDQPIDVPAVPTLPDANLRYQLEEAPSPNQWQPRQSVPPLLPNVTAPGPGPGGQQTFA